MNADGKLRIRSVSAIVPLFLFFLFCPTRAHAQYLIVDCTGATPGAYPSITAALPNATPGSSILVTGPCNENVTLSYLNQVNLGAYYGQTATIDGAVSINNSQNLFLYGLNVTNAAGNGITVNNSKSIEIDVCSSNGNAGVGLSVYGTSDVNIGASGTFDRNTAGGISIGNNSYVSVSAWAGQVDISNNGGPGLWASEASFSTLGSTTIVNNVFGSGSNSGFGIDLRGGAHAQIGALFGPNVISGNQSGGAWVQETAEISFWSIGQPNLIQGNGPVGVMVGLGGQVTFADISGPLGALISDHTTAGVDLYGNSQAYFLGANQVLRNGTSTNARTAGIRVDGNSEVYLRGGQVSQNNGPGILALVNSSADFTGVTFSGNAQGEIIACDSSSTMVSDLTRPNSSYVPAGVVCKTPHALGNRDNFKSVPPVPDWSGHKALYDRYAKIAVKH
jgi:Right handed beta helix region